MSYLKPEERIERRVALLFDMRVISEMSKRTGYPQSTLLSWKKHPTRIRAVDLEILEEKLGKPSVTE